MQATAAASLRRLIKSETCTRVIEPLLHSVLGEFMRLMRELPVDDLVSALESIIEKFGDKILPFAHELVGQLAATFLRHLEECDKDDDEATMAAMNTLECVLAVLQKAQSQPHIFPALETALLPLLHVSCVSKKL